MEHFGLYCGIGGMVRSSEAGFGNFLKKAGNTVNKSIGKTNGNTSGKDGTEKGLEQPNGAEKGPEKLNRAFAEARKKDGVVWLTYLAGGDFGKTHGAKGFPSIPMENSWIKHAEACLSTSRTGFGF